MPTYFAEISGSSFARPDVAEFPTITAARKWAESYGTTADRCIIRRHRGKVVAIHARDTAGSGARWYKATA